MASVTLHGTTINLGGRLPEVGEKVADFALVKGDLNEAHLADFKGKRKVFNIVPSLDTSVCATSARRFNQLASSVPNTVVLVISADLPFAQKRFCEVEGLADVVPLSTFRSSFSDDYGLKIVDGPMAGLNARAVLVLDEDDRVIYRELVPEIAQEPDYEKALAVLKA